MVHASWKASATCSRVAPAFHASTCEHSLAPCTPPAMRSISTRVTSRSPPYPSDVVAPTTPIEADEPKLAPLAWSFLAWPWGREVADGRDPRCRPSRETDRRALGASVLDEH